MNDVSCGIGIWEELSFVLSQSRCLSGGWTNGFLVATCNCTVENRSRYSRNPFTTPFDVILHCFDSAPVTNLSVKFNANIVIGDRYMVILQLCQFGCEMPIPAHFGEVFWGLIP